MFPPPPAPWDPPPDDFDFDFDTKTDPGLSTIPPATPETLSAGESPHRRPSLTVTTCAERQEVDRPSIQHDSPSSSAHHSPSPTRSGGPLAAPSQGNTPSLGISKRSGGGLHLATRLSSPSKIIPEKYLEEGSHARSRLVSGSTSEFVQIAGAGDEGTADARRWRQDAREADQGELRGQDNMSARAASSSSSSSLGGTSLPSMSNIVSHLSPRRSTSHPRRSPPTDGMDYPLLSSRSPYPRQAYAAAAGDPFELSGGLTKKVANGEGEPGGELIEGEAEQRVDDGAAGEEHSYDSPLDMSDEWAVHAAADFISWLEGNVRVWVRDGRRDAEIEISEALGRCAASRKLAL
eukprot:Sspe_Gene.61330::Locus_34028_Transcript_1_1_Confidence_1.000_Length_1061::g.61330::m.61330